jgi:hypothetical protein
MVLLQLSQHARRITAGNSPSAWADTAGRDEITARWAVDENHRPRPAPHPSPRWRFWHRLPVRPWARAYATRARAAVERARLTASVNISRVKGLSRV